MAVVEMELLFSTPMPPIIETPSRIQSADQNELTEIAYEMINVMEHFVTDFQEFKASTAEKIHKIERLLWENVTGHETVQTEYIKQQVELLQNENNRLRMESESLVKVIELLSVQQTDSHEGNDNTDFVTVNFITVKETGKNKKIKLNHQQDSRIPLRNSFEILPIEECQEKPEPTDDENSMSPSFDYALSKRRQKKPSTKHNKQSEAYITNNQYEEPLVQRKARIVPGGITYLEATKFGKKICVIGDSHLNRIKDNIFQKSVNGGKTYFHVFQGTTSKRLNHYILPTLQEDHPDVVLRHIGSNDITNNQTKDRINTGKLTGDTINIGKSCINFGVKEVVISSILPKKNIALTRLIRLVNDSLREQFVLNRFGFISNDNISRTHLWKNGIHLKDLGTNIVAGNFVDFLN